MGRKNKGKVCFCGEPVYAKGLCKKHYYQNYRRRPRVRFKRKIKRKIQKLK